MKQIYYKQNEKFEYEFFKDKECKEAFKFETSEVLYVELKNGDISPLTYIERISKWELYIATPYLPKKGSFYMDFDNVKTLKDITPNYSKYIPNDCAVMFLNKWEYVDNFQKYNNILKECPIYIKDHSNPELCQNKDCACQGGWDIYPMHNTTSSQLPKKVILFTPELTSTNIKQINDTAKVLKENFGIEWVGVFAELCFIENPPPAWAVIGEDGYFGVMVNGKLKNAYFDKLITTNATGLLEPQESEHLQVIDCKEIFEEYIKTNE